MPSKVVIDDGRRCRTGSSVAFVPAEAGSRTIRMIEDTAGPYTLRTRASLRMGEVKLLHVTVKRRKPRPEGKPSS